jgi:hypothetical protein
MIGAWCFSGSRWRLAGLSPPAKAASLKCAFQEQQRQQCLSARNMAQKAASRAVARKSEICNLSHKFLNLLQSCYGDDFLSRSHIKKWVLSLTLPFFHHPRAACPCLRRMRRISARQWKLSMPTALQRVYHIHLSILRRQVSPYLLQHLSLYKMHDRSLSPPQPESTE